MSDAPRTRKTSRSHITTACTSCRESKVKCDGHRPECSRCGKRGTKCSYPVGEDKRKVSLQNVVSLLFDRVDRLAQFIDRHGLQAPVMEMESRLVFATLLDTIPIPWSALTGTDDASGRIDRTPGTTRPQSFPSNESNLGNPELDYSPNIDHMNAVIDLGLTKEAVESFPRQNTEHSFEENDFQNSADNTVINPHNIEDMVLENSTNYFWGSFQQMGPISTDHFDWELLNGLATNSEKDTDPYSTLVFDPTLDTQTVDAQSVEDNTDDEIIASLSARLGVLQVAPDGQLRYYGATSNFNLLKITLDPIHSLETRSIRSNGQEILDRAKVGAWINRELEDHVINLYFTWQDPSYHVVDRQMFDTARELWDNGVENNPYYSDVLKNAMCALGAAFEGRFHPDFATFPKPLAEYFADRAKALLDLELDCPTVATVQALVILSSHEAAYKRDARGWLYSGMAMRLALDLGLHVDNTESVRRGQMTAAEAAVRRTAFWGCFVVTHVWSFYLGRDFRVTSGDISVQRPSSLHTEVRTWRLYGSTVTFIETRFHHEDIADPLELISRQWVILCEMIGPLAHVLYGCAEISKSELQELSEKTTRQLWFWKEALSSELQIDINSNDSHYLPHILMLHMQYYSFLIFVHRPWTSKTSIQPFPPQGPGHTHARKVCVESAVAVARILRMYEKSYTFRFMNIQAVHIIFTSIPVLIFATMWSSMPNTDQNLATHLGTCFRALEVLGQVFDNAKRAYGYLQAMQRTWPDLMRQNQASKRRKLV